MANVSHLQHPNVVCAITALLTGATSLMASFSGPHSNYLRFWAPARLFLARLLAFSVHAGLGVLVWWLADSHSWLPINDEHLWFLNAFVYAAVTEAAFRADWAGLWLEPAGSAWSFVRGFDKGLGRLVNARAQRAQRRLVDRLPARSLVGQTYRLLVLEFGQQPTSPAGQELYDLVNENREVIDMLGPLEDRTDDQVGRLGGAMGAIGEVAVELIQRRLDILGDSNRSLRQAVGQLRAQRPTGIRFAIPWCWP